MERGVELIMQSGVPLPLLTGIEATIGSSTVSRSAAASPRPRLSSASVAAAKQLGLRRMAVANKWSGDEQDAR